jgi:hypothetical protein
MRVCGRHFTTDVLARIEEAVGAEPTISRRSLSRRVCGWLEWRSVGGQFQEMSCRKALAELNRRGVLKLPERDGAWGFDRTAETTVEFAAPELSCSINDLGEVTVSPVRSRYCKESKIWRALLDRFHYLGIGQSRGAQVRYVVKSSRYGYLGALAFGSAVWALRARDEYIGWTEGARRANLGRVVCNDRFLILPSVMVKNLASHVLALTLSRLPEDWEARYSVRPVLAETFVDRSRFAGTCYAAANWIDVGETAGRRDGNKKAIFIRPLCSRWRGRLLEEPPERLGESPRPESPAGWAEEEFGSVRFYDRRLKERLYRIAEDFYGSPQANIPEACGGKAGAMGAYRFFQNKKVTMDIILTAHTETVIERIKQHKVVLAPQDTTTLDYTTHPMTEDVGPVSHKNEACIGLLLHDTLAFTEDGVPLGILDAQCWARDPQDRAKKDRRKDLPIEQKESMKWLRSFRKVAEVQRLCPDTTLVSMGDRESDIYELFLEAIQDPRGPKLLVRMGKGSQRKVGEDLLWSFMAGREVAGALDIHIPRSGSRQARDTTIDVRFSDVELKPPVRCKGSASIHAWAVYVVEQEEQAPADSPIEWMLLTTAEVAGFEDARKRVQWYSGRWGIEVYHRTLKSGCKIKDRQLGTADRLEACLGVDMVVAWRVYHLAMLGRDTPELPCTAFFKEQEWKALCCYVSKSPVAPSMPPTLGQAMRMVGAIGGHLGRKSDGAPGTQTLWRGLQRLDTATEMYVIFTDQQPPHSFQSGP